MPPYVNRAGVRGRCHLHIFIVLHFMEDIPNAFPATVHAGTNS
jgi:hypothetical protein